MCLRASVLCVWSHLLWCSPNCKRPLWVWWKIWRGFRLLLASTMLNSSILYHVTDLKPLWPRIQEYACDSCWTVSWPFVVLPSWRSSGTSHKWHLFPGRLGNVHLPKPWGEHGLWLQGWSPFSRPKSADVNRCPLQLQKSWVSTSLAFNFLLPSPLPSHGGFWLLQKQWLLQGRAKSPPLWAEVSRPLQPPLPSVAPGCSYCGCCACDVPMTERCGKRW